MNRKLILIFSFIVFFNISVKAQLQTNSFNLQQCIDYAYKNQVNVKNASIDKEIARYKIKETTGIGLPQIKSVSTYNYFIDVPTQVIPRSAFGDASGGFLTPQFGIANTLSYGLEASQILFNGSYLVGLQASKTYAELSNKALDRTKIDVNVAVSKAYYQLLIARERLILLDANIDRLAKSFKEIKALNENGFVEKIDVDRLTVLSNNIQTERSNVLRLLDLNNNLLKFQMGMPIGDKLIIYEKIEDISFAKETVLADTSAFMSRPEYALLQTQKKLNQLDLKRYKFQFLPSLAAFGNFSTAFQSNNFNTLFDRSFPTSLIGLQLNVPIFSGGQKYYRVKQAQLAVKKSDNDLYNLQNGINLQINQSQTAYINGLESLENQKRNRELAQEVLRVTKIKYEQGIGSSLEVTTAETSLKESETNYINSLYDALNNKVNLDKALGRIQ